MIMKGDGESHSSAPADLPADGLCAIGRWLELPTRARLRRVSKAWRAGMDGAFAAETRLDLHRFRASLDDCGVAALARACPHLRELSLCGCALLTDVALGALAANCVELRAVNIACVRSFGLDAIRALARACPLEDLHLAGSALDATIIRKHFAHLVELEEDEDGNMGSTD
ncbi:hypothetical protein KFE25_006514 [Diacronema lutheri]|uniref:F-box domain-containing protein n=2 Tax=Diacronema lutheri TaxID=2081491 RepID=A0A8J5X7N5_DIALT|nr:hypothetical protein KFE25_006514 [Diacronema lutheri]